MNDIDDILNSMFKDGKLNISKAQESAVAASEALKEIEKTNEKISQSLEDRIKKLTEDVQSDLGETQKRLEADGFAEKTDGVPKELKYSPETMELFTAAEQATNKEVLGQEAFIASISVAFKRPLIMGTQPGMPSSKAILIGKNGTGKHLALQNFASELQTKGVLKCGEISYIDLSKYGDTSSEKAFIQDFYSVVSSKTQIIAFENFDMCHNSVLTLVSALFTKGVVPLQGRYSVQKGGLAEIGNALVPNVVSELAASDKYLFIITEKDEKKLVDVFGMPFLTSCDSICKTADFTDESILAIADKKLKALCEDIKSRFDINVGYDKFAVETLASKFVPSGGVESIGNYLDALKKQLGEYKLKNVDVSSSASIISSEGDLAIKLDNQLVTVTANTGVSDSAVSEVKKELEDIVGLSFIKEYILSLEDNFKIQQMRLEKGMKADVPSMHMIFTGNPGTGKTTIARIVSRYLKAIGVLSGGQLIEVTRADLVGKYVGHTAPLTQKAIQSALGGVLFIDEAYSLFRGNDDSFGLEAIDTLVKGMEDNRDNLVVILAGYSNEMAEFLTANSGLKSRFPNIIEFPDYSADELVKITESIVQSRGYEMTEECKSPLFVYYDIEQKTGDPRTNGNGRMARNKVEEAIINCSKRNLKLPESEMNLELLTLEDFALKNHKE